MNWLWRCWNSFRRWLRGTSFNLSPTEYDTLGMDEDGEDIRDQKRREWQRRQIKKAIRKGKP